MHLKIDKGVIRLIDQSLAEDDAKRDITSQVLLAADRYTEGRIIVREQAVLSGLDVAKTVFKRLDKRISFRSLYTDSASLKSGVSLAVIKGPARSILAGERTALNFLGHLSGVATLTRAFVKKTKGTRVQILDTRKTIPGLRSLQKYAVRCGGGVNHRFSLSQAAMIKDNHFILLGENFSFPDTVARLRKKRKPLVVEVEQLKYLPDAVSARPDVILLDNMTLAQLRQAVKIRNRLNKKVRLEVSGGVNLRTARNIARTGIDRISVGAITHSAGNIDFSFEITKK